MPNSDDDLSSLIKKWIEAVDSFYEWHHKLSKVIAEFSVNKNYLVINDTSWPMADFIQMQSDLAAGLESLERDMDLDEGADSLLKKQKLKSHTLTITSWTKAIQNALRLGLFGTS